MIQLTENALKKVRSVRATNDAFAEKPFRVFIQAGGCSGYNYGFNFDDKRDDDVSVMIDGLEVIVDPQSLKLIQNATVDWVEDFRGAGFNVKNPNATGSCGCGTSFTVSEKN